MRRWWRLSFAPILCALIGCGGDDDDGGKAPSGTTITNGDYSVRVDPNKNTIELSRSDTKLVEFPVSSFVLGTVDEVADSVNYDPAPLLTGAPGAKEPSGMTWNAATKLKIQSQASDRLEIALTHDGDLGS